MGNPEVRDPNSERTPKPKLEARSQGPPLVWAACVPFGPFCPFAAYQWGYQPWQATGRSPPSWLNLNPPSARKRKKLRTAIEVALAKDDLKTAGEKLLEFEAVAGVAAAKDLRGKYEGKAGEPSDAGIAEAFVARERVTPLDRGQGLGVKLERWRWRGGGGGGRQGKSWGGRWAGTKPCCNR